MTIDKSLSRKRSERARGQDRDEWGRFCKFQRRSTSNDGSSTDGRYSHGTSSDGGLSDGEYIGRFEIESMSSEDQDMRVQQCESSRKAEKKMKGMDKNTVKKQRNGGAVAPSNNYYIDLVSSDEEEIVPKPCQTAADWVKKSRAMEKGTEKKGKSKSSDMKQNAKGKQEKGKKVSSTYD